MWSIAAVGACWFQALRALEDGGPGATAGAWFAFQFGLVWVAATVLVVAWRLTTSGYLRRAGSRAWHDLELLSEGEPCAVHVSRRGVSVRTAGRLAAHPPEDLRAVTRTEEHVVLWLTDGVLHAGAPLIDGDLDALHEAALAAVATTWPRRPTGERGQRLADRLEALLELLDEEAAAEVRVDPYEIRRIERLVRALGDQAQVELAETAMAYAVALFPQSGEALVSVGEMHRVAERYDEAERAYLRALHVEPSHAYALAGYGEARRMLGDPRDAEAAYRDALALVPEHAFSLQGLAAALQALGRHEEALPFWKAALEQEPGSTFAQAGLAASAAALDLPD